MYLIYFIYFIYILHILHILYIFCTSFYCLISLFYNLLFFSLFQGGQDGHLHIWDVQGNHVIKNNIKNNILYIKWVYNRLAFVTSKYINNL